VAARAVARTTARSGRAASGMSSMTSSPRHRASSTPTQVSAVVVGYPFVRFELTDPKECESRRRLSTTTKEWPMQCQVSSVVLRVKPSSHCQCTTYSVCQCSLFRVKTPDPPPPHRPLNRRSKYTTLYHSPGLTFCVCGHRQCTTRSSCRCRPAAPSSGSGRPTRSRDTSRCR
jgi:hypothetical protein